MTLRERIADWISGGALSRAHVRAECLWMECRQVSDYWDQAEADVVARTDALSRIIAEEKPTSNATVRRMARIAREALE